MASRGGPSSSLRLCISLILLAILYIANYDFFFGATELRYNISMLYHHHHRHIDRNHDSASEIALSASSPPLLFVLVLVSLPPSNLRKR